jgi:DNA-binding HxlR family transcriptional regulator
MASVIEHSGPSPLEAALTQVGDRWTLLVVDGLLDGPRRFNQLAESVPGLATNVLSQRLKRLEADGIVLAQPYQQRPLRYTYELTAAGRDLAGALRLLAQWGADHGLDRPAGTEHGDCGTPLEARWYCPTCDLVLDPDEGAPDKPTYL